MTDKTSSPSATNDTLIERLQAAKCGDLSEIDMAALLDDATMALASTPSHEQRITASGVQQADALPAVHQGQETKAPGLSVPSTTPRIHADTLSEIQFGLALLANEDGANLGKPEWLTSVKKWAHDMQVALEETALSATPCSREKELLDALAVSILSSDYGDRCHAGTFTPNKHVKTPVEFVIWARDRLGEDYDPTCQYPITAAIRSPDGGKQT